MSEQLELFDVPSPCIGVCTSGPEGYCKGCFRTRDERFHWNLFTNSQKKQVIHLCRIRKIKLIRQMLAKNATPEEAPSSPQMELFE
ncbi:DUF1289 domain-containing protein [Basilea psittacipulmonis]|uniref:Fe-S protein n=1 Tax=Basilea psittacipulmonis DSM 24701 TaxID=1072685 RepID=A0A077DEX6_9BURK|nr:DUF1289 domain-containing protein [Basilea psittacipulmonis]AIL31977.1 hypothetical protein IX83_00355 [Basilea psittacipulmonis DSM 24701]